MITYCGFEVMGNGSTEEVMTALTHAMLVVVAIFEEAGPVRERKTKLNTVQASCDSEAIGDIASQTVL
jgi:hypothetical protein